MSWQRFSVDTNILIYSIDQDAGPRHEQARAIMAETALVTERNEKKSLAAQTELVQYETPNGACPFGT